ncbi:unnamed protein product, partial [Symbiodinium sp. KB8]
VTGATDVYRWPASSPGSNLLDEVGRGPIEEQAVSPPPLVQPPAPSRTSLGRWFSLLDFGDVRGSDWFTPSPFWPGLLAGSFVCQFPCSWHKHWKLWHAMQHLAPWSVQAYRAALPLRRASVVTAVSGPAASHPPAGVLDFLAASVSFRLVCNALRSRGVAWMFGTPRRVGLSLLRSLLPLAVFHFLPAGQSRIFVVEHPTSSSPVWRQELSLLRAFCSHFICLPHAEGIRHPSQIERPWYVWHGPSKGLRVGGDRDASDSEEEADKVADRLADGDNPARPLLMQAAERARKSGFSLAAAARALLGTAPAVDMIEARSVCGFHVQGSVEQLGSIRTGRMLRIPLLLYGRPVYKLEDEAQYLYFMHEGGCFLDGYSPSFKSFAAAADPAILSNLFEVEGYWAIGTHVGNARGSDSCHGFSWDLAITPDEIQKSWQNEESLKFAPFPTTESRMVEVERGRASRRQRDCFPLRCVANVEFKPSDMSTLRWSPLRDFVNVVVNSLNWLYGAKRSDTAPRERTLNQRHILTRIVNRAVDSLRGLQDVRAGSWERFLPDFVPFADKGSATCFQELVADRVDNLRLAAACDPTPSLPVAVQTVVADSEALFAGAPRGLELFENFSAGSRVEYVKLIVAQLRCGKLGLSQVCKGGGTSLAVGKPGGLRLREVWHGRRVSQAAEVPPKPRHLASPTALTLLEAGEDKPVRVSKRDASCWFDQLKLPQCLPQYMAKPAVSTTELVAAGMPSHEQARYLEDGQVWREGQYYPLHRVWPMGFSWSSYIAQEQMLDVCAKAGLAESSLLACDCETPESFDLATAVATDDVMLFSNAGPGITLAAAQALDCEFEERGLVRNAAKDVNDELSATCVGVNLVDGKYLDVPAARYLAMLLSFFFLHRRAVGSPKQVQQLLGALQWYDLLLRPKLSIYEAVYAFTRMELPCEVLAELSCSLCLAVFWRCDLTRPFLPLLGATDASTEYGFGASVVRTSEACVRRVARWAERQGAFIVMDGGADLAHRLGPGHQLDLSLDDFTDIFSVKSGCPAHINVLEGEAFVLFLRWLLRCSYGLFVMKFANALQMGPGHFAARLTSL